jgi:hypothetical protein
MVLIFLGPFALSQLLLPLLSSSNHGLYTLAPVKYKTICPTPMSLRPIQSLRFMPLRMVSSTFMSSVVYAMQHMPHNITN